MGEFHLYGFISDQLERPCTLLIGGRSKEAIPLFEQALNRDSNDLGAFVGLMQANPALWPQQTEELEKRLKAHPEDSNLQFKLGVLLYYRWLSLDHNAAYGEIALRSRFANLVEAAWKHDTRPLVGFMLYDLDGIRNRTLQPPVLKQMLQQLAGPSAYAQYLQASTHHWQAKPPAPDLVPPANRKAFLRVIAEYLALSGRTADGELKNGKVVFTWNTFSLEQQKKLKYFDVWLKSLEKASPGL